MTLPSQYSYLTKPDVPVLVKKALELYGTLEAPGDKDNPVILAWAKELGNKVGIAYAHDSIPWCGLFVALCCKRAGLPIPSIAVRASSWDVAGIPADQARLGDILRFQRPGGGHVGIYVAEDATHYHVLGGNQSDSVNITRIAKARCVAIRRVAPLTAASQPVKLASVGKISENEA